MTDALRRAVRTLAQAFTGVLMLQAATVALAIGNGTYVPDVNWLKRVFISAAAAAAVALISFIHNWSEDNAGLPAVLKATPSAGEHPVAISPAK